MYLVPFCNNFLLVTLLIMISLYILRFVLEYHSQISYLGHICHKNIHMLELWWELATGKKKCPHSPTWLDFYKEIKKTGLQKLIYSDSFWLFSGLVLFHYQYLLIWFPLISGILPDKRLGTNVANIWWAFNFLSSVKIFCYMWGYPDWQRCFQEL